MKYYVNKGKGVFRIKVVKCSYMCYEFVLGGFI